MAVRMAATAEAIHAELRHRGSNYRSSIRQVIEQPGSQGAMHGSREPYTNLLDIQLQTSTNDAYLVLEIWAVHTCIAARA